MKLKENLLCIVPPYVSTYAPAGPAALLGYLKSHGVNDFDFIDFRYWMRNSDAHTYAPIGAFGETFVHDVAELPLVLNVLKAYRENRPPLDGIDAVLEDYCIARGMSFSRHEFYLKSLDRFFEKAFSAIERPRFVGFSVWVSNYLTTLIAVCRLKMKLPDVFVVAGGPQVSQSLNSARLGLKSGLFDAVVKGEGEGPLLDLYQEFVRGNGTVSRAVPGVMRYDRSVKDVILAPNDQLKMKDVALPSYDEMPLWLYQRDGKMSLPMGFTRGCTDKCSFCSEWVFWRHFRSDDPDNALNKIQQLVTKYGARRIYFTDSLLNGHPKKLEALAEGILSRGLELEWWSFMRAQMSPEMAKLIYRAGCRSVFVGVESMSDDTLKLMNKRRTEGDNTAALKNFFEAGIHVQAGIIPGFPGSDRASFLRTVKVMRSLQIDNPGLLDFNVEPFSVFPGQPVYEDLPRFGLTPQPWPDEVLDIDPEYREITSKVHCTVTGSNQGLERFGQYQVCRTVAASTGEGQSTMLSFGMNPKFNAREIVFSPSRGGWHVGSIITDGAMIHSLAFSEEEKSRYLALVEKAAEKTSLRLGLRVLEIPQIVEFLKRIRSRHIVSPDPYEPAIVPAGHTLDNSNEVRVTLSPVIVAREISADLILFFEMNRPESQFFVPTQVVTPSLVKYLARPRSLRDVRRFLKKYMAQEEETLLIAMSLLRSARAVIFPRPDDKRRSAPSRALFEAPVLA